MQNQVLTSLYGCGYQTGLEQDSSRSDWDNKGPRPLKYSIWYPTKHGALNKAMSKKPISFFDLGDVAVNAPISTDDTWPVVLLSHGTGGTAESIGWLARFF